MLMLKISKISAKKLDQILFNPDFSVEHKV